MDIEVCRHFYDVPCARLPIVGEVHVVLVVEQAQADLVSGKGPGPKLHDTGLLVKREVRDVYCAGRLKKICQEINLQTLFLWRLHIIFVTTNLISKYSCSGFTNKMYMERVKGCEHSQIHLVHTFVSESNKV